jgi:hypothetical protein
MRSYQRKAGYYFFPELLVQNKESRLNKWGGGGVLRLWQYLECMASYDGIGKAIPVTGRGGPGCETSRFPHFLDNRITDGGEVVSPTSQPPFAPRKIPGTHFC